MKAHKVNSSSVKITLDTRRAKADGTYPVILRLSHNRKSTSIKTGIYLKKEDWDGEALQVKKSYKGSSNVSRLNNELQKKKAEAIDKILQLDTKEKNRKLSVADIKQHIDPTIQSTSFYDYAESLIKMLIKAERIGTAKSYEGVVNVLKTYNKGKPLEKNKGGNSKSANKLKFAANFKAVNFRDLLFEEITYSFLKDFESYHLASGNGLNGLAVYMRTIRSIYNQGIKDKRAEKADYPFSDYKIKSEPTKKRALDNAYLKKIIALEFSENVSSFHARNYFVASYLMYGMNFTDMAHLQKKDITNGRINYRRRKTSKLYDIKITPALEVILTHYLSQSKQAEYVFPIIKRSDAIGKAKDIQTARKKYNENLRDIAEICGIDQNLTSYVSRHSFATQAMLNQIPINAISAMLGHSSLKTTEIYLKSLPSEILDDYNASILGPV